MAAPDRIRLIGSLRKGPRKGALLFGGCPEFWLQGSHKSGQSRRAAEDSGLAGLGPLVLDPREPAEAPAREQLERLRVALPIGVVEQQVAAGTHPPHCRFQA